MAAAIKTSDVLLLSQDNSRKFISNGQMADQADQIVVRGIKLAFAKRKHFRAASELWIKASSRGNRRAIRLLGCVMLNDIHGGRKEQRPIVLAALKSASILNSRYEGLYLLFALVTAPVPDIIDSFVRLAQSGDVLASLVMGKTIDHTRALMDYGYLVQAYRLLVQTFVKARNVIAARLIALQLQTDGHLLEALSLVVWAANRGDFISLAQAPGAASNLGLALVAKDSERDSVFALARHKAFVCRDPGAALWLGLCFGDLGWGHVLDIVARIRMFRLVFVMDADLIILPIFGGETLWRPLPGNRVAGFEPLYEEQKASKELFHFRVVPLIGTN